jgi:S1-C subfamily serine protease
MTSHSQLPLFAALLIFACPARALADKLQITSNPSGAAVELDGVAVGTTPFEKDFPGGYFHKTRTSLGARLEHPLIARLSFPGYVAKELKLTEGPMNWISLNGRNRGEYWLLKSNHFHVDLQPISETFTGAVTANVSDSSVGLQPELSLEDVVGKTKPAVVYLKGVDKAGSGFFVTATGIIATNAHLVRDEESLVAVLSTGEQLEAKVVHVEPDLDIALAKVERPSSKIQFPHLVLTTADSVRQGETVIAIGNPGGALPFSVTKGIVSAVGEFPEAGPGTWIQTDASINPGNSGGPLLNSRGELIGINTQKLVKKNVTGIGFALSASDLLAVLHHFYPSTVQLTEKLSAPARSTDTTSVLPSAEGFGTVIFSEPAGAEIWLDSNFVGSIPARLKLTASKHLLVIKDHVHADWIRSITVQKDSEVTLKPDFP